MITITKMRNPNDFNDLVIKRELVYKIGRVVVKEGDPEPNPDDIEMKEIEHVEYDYEDQWFNKNGWEIVSVEKYLTLDLNQVVRGISEKKDGTRAFWHIERPV